MARKCLYRVADNFIIAHGFMSFSPTPSEAVAEVPTDYVVDRRLHRYAANAAGFRLATAQEIAIYDDSLKTSAAQAEIDAAVLKGIVRALLDELDLLAPAPIDRTAFRQRAINYIKQAF